MIDAITRKISVAWQDIREFKNLELYLILLVILALFVFEIFGAPSGSALTEVLLAGIAVLIYGQLDNRHREQTVADQLELLTKQISELRDKQGYYVQVYPHGRSGFFDFAAFLERAHDEIIIIGISLTAFSQRFAELPAPEFKDRVAHLLAKGVEVKCLLLDPQSDVTLHYASDRNESEIQKRIVRSTSLLHQVSMEFGQRNLAEKFKVYTYAHLPYCYLALIDPTHENGAAIVSHYLYKTTRTETPMFHLDKATNPILFEKYHKMACDLLEDSTLLWET